jgi:hypothetical protein
MTSADLAAWWAAYHAQILVGLAVVVVSFVVLKAMGRVVRFVVLLAVGGAAGIGTAYGLTRLGVPGKLAYWGAVAIALVVLLAGASGHPRKD